MIIREVMRDTARAEEGWLENEVSRAIPEKMSH